MAYSETYMYNADKTVEQKDDINAIFLYLMLLTKYVYQQLRNYLIN